MYSFQKGFNKGLVSLLTIIGSFLAFTTFSDMTLWSLLEENLKPLLGSLTIGGAITMLINYLKFNKFGAKLAARVYDRVEEREITDEIS